MLKEYQKLASDQYVQLHTLTESVTELKVANHQTQLKFKEIIGQMVKAREEMDLVVNLMKSLHEGNETLRKQNILLKERIRLLQEDPEDTL